MPKNLLRKEMHKIGVKKSKGVSSLLFVALIDNNICAAQIGRQFVDNSLV